MKTLSGGSSLELGAPLPEAVLAISLEGQNLRGETLGAELAGERRLLMFIRQLG